MKKIILLSLLIFISCGDKKEEIVIEPYTSGSIEEPKEQYYFDKNTDSILKSIGIEDISSINKQDLPVYMKSIEKGVFKDKSFCEFYRDYKMYEFKNDLKKSDEVVKPLSDNITLLTLLGANGYKLCPVALQEARIASKNPIYAPKKVYEDSTLDPCIISKDFIKKDLQNPSTADFSMFDCSKEQNFDRSYVILRKVTAKNALGVEKSFIYKLKIAFLGGNAADINNWKLLTIHSEEYK